jgi:alcohol dehydrogenase
MIAKIALPRILRVGGGAFQETGQLLSGLGLCSPLIVTDAFFARQGLADRLSEILKQSSVASSPEAYRTRPLPRSMPAFTR